MTRRYWKQIMIHSFSFLWVSFKLPRWQHICCVTGWVSLFGVLFCFCGWHKIMRCWAIYSTASGVWFKNRFQRFNITVKVRFQCWLFRIKANRFLFRSPRMQCKHKKWCVWGKSVRLMETRQIKVKLVQRNYWTSSKIVFECSKHHKLIPCDGVFLLYSNRVEHFWLDKNTCCSQRWQQNSLGSVCRVDTNRWKTVDQGSDTSCPLPTEQASAGILSTTCWPPGSGG